MPTPRKNTASFSTFDKSTISEHTLLLLRRLCIQISKSPIIAASQPPSQTITQARDVSIGVQLPPSSYCFLRRESSPSPITQTVQHQSSPPTSHLHTQSLLRRLCNLSAIASLL